MQSVNFWEMMVEILADFHAILHVRKISFSLKIQEYIFVSDWPVCEHVGEAEMLVVLLAVQVEEVGHVNVRHAERVRLVSRPAWTKPNHTAHSCITGEIY